MTYHGNRRNSRPVLPIANAFEKGVESTYFRGSASERRYPDARRQGGKEFIIYQKRYCARLFRLAFRRRLILVRKRGGYSDFDERLCVGTGGLRAYRNAGSL